MTFSIITEHCYAECHKKAPYPECHNVECVLMSVVMLSVVAPPTALGALVVCSSASSANRDGAQTLHFAT
jgi:hypothetical protein